MLEGLSTHVVSVPLTDLNIEIVILTIFDQLKHFVAAGFSI